LFFPPHFSQLFNSPFFGEKPSHTMATTKAAATASRTERAAQGTLHGTQNAQGGARKSTNPPDRALAVQTGGNASDAASRRLEMVSLPPRLTKAHKAPRLTKAQKEAQALAAAKADADMRAKVHQRYIRVKAARLSVTEEEAEKIAQDENARACALAQQKFADNRTREYGPSSDIVWGGKDVGWVPRE
jgi:hypothetical protein